MRQRAAERGFTLLEVLVALTVLGISLAVLFPAFSGVMRSQKRLTDERTALLLAESKLDTIGSETPIADGSSAGTFENGFGWRVEIKPYPVSVQNTLMEAKLVTLTVLWPHADGDRRYTLSTVRVVGRQ